MADYTNFVAMAKRLLDKKGRKITLQQLGSQSSDPSMPWKSDAQTSVIAEYSNVSACFVAAIGKDLGIKVEDKELLKRTTQVAIVEAVAEDIADKIARIQDTDSTYWRVVWAQILKPADQTVIYIFGVSR